MEYYMGIDLGTTHLKAGIFSEDGVPKEIFSVNTPVHREQQGEYYDPTEWMKLLQAMLDRGEEKYGRMRGIGITGMAEAGIMLDRHSLRPLTGIIPWYDKRTFPISGRMTKEEEQEAFCKTGLRNSYKYGIYKYLWSLENSGISPESTLWLSACDYIFFCLTGELATDPTFAARTFVYDIRKRQWDGERIQAMGLREENFPKIVPSGRFAGAMKGTGIPVAICGHDHLCSAFGLLEQEGELCDSCGTAETYIGLMDQLPEDAMARDSGLVFGPFVTEGRYFGMANLSSSGQSLEWLRKCVGGGALTYDRIGEMLEAGMNGPGEILYLPYLSGMGSPLFLPEATGALLGLRAAHTIADLVKAVIEGVCCQCRWILETGFGKGEAAVIATGGSTALCQWMQYKADILNKKVSVSRIGEGTLFGAAALMLEQNTGRRPVLSGRFSREYFPEPVRAEAYDTFYFKKFLPCMRAWTSFYREV